MTTIVAGHIIALVTKLYRQDVTVNWILAECITMIFIILCVAFKLLWSNMAKRHFQKIDCNCQIFSVTSPKAQYVDNQWQIRKIQQVAMLR